ncbi:MAG: metallophosphoesterase [Nocardioides sp.]|nr:metallophosphoesterase [Nocardioides sp.]
MSPSRRTLHVSIAAGVAVAVAGTSAAVYAAAPHIDDWPYADHGSGPSHAKPVTLAAVGDVACEPDDPENSGTPAALKCGSPDLGGQSAAYATADEVEAMRPNLVALLGDEQYEVGKLSDFQQSFDKTYGAFKFLQRPAPGNHEYYPYTKKGDNEAGQNGNGYFSYYNGTDANGAIRPQGQAGDDTDSTQGWYSYELGKWHVISLNAECDSAAFGNNCNPDHGLLDAETTWLQSDLDADHQPCTIAYWHQPTFSATDSPSTEGGAADAWWKLLYAHGHAVVLNGHEHLYARFQPMNPAGEVDTQHGIPEFIIGSGGEALDELAPQADLDKAHVVTGEDDAYGAMKLTLGDGRYSWDFEPAKAAPGAPASAMDYSDTGSARC